MVQQKDKKSAKGEYNSFEGVLLSYQKDKTAIRSEVAVLVL